MYCGVESSVHELARLSALRVLALRRLHLTGLIEGEGTETLKRKRAAEAKAREGEQAEQKTDGDQPPVSVATPLASEGM